ncbi:MAG: peptidase M61, partial [Candidatus Eremiobacteraeota bacterium]|nr:peptidase M61 [Candidatus Eremiobacteraeota bacterium]
MRALVIGSALALALVTQRPAQAAVSALATQSNPMILDVDAREAARGLLRTHFRVPVAPGAFTLVYAKW